jgi:hypothetical protein
LYASKRDNVHIQGTGDRMMIFSHGFGCDQNMWRFVAPAFESDFRTVLFDHVGAGGSDLTAYEPAKYASLSGYADDLVEIAPELRRWAAGGGSDAFAYTAAPSRPMLSLLPPFQHVGAGLRQQTAGRIMPSIVVSLDASVDPITYDCGWGWTRRALRASTPLCGRNFG